MRSIQIYLGGNGIALGLCAEFRRPVFIPVAQLCTGGRKPSCLIFSLLSTAELHTHVCIRFASRSRINATGVRRRLMTFSLKAINAGGRKMTKGMFATWKILLSCTRHFPLALIHCSFSFPSCAKLNKIALSKGNATHDQVCLDRLPTYLTSSTLSMQFSNETNNSDLRTVEENLVTMGSILFSAITTENPSSTPEEKALAGTFPTSAKGETTMGGNKDKAFTLRSMFYLDISLVNAIFMWELPVNPLWLVKWCPNTYLLIVLPLPFLSLSCAPFPFLCCRSSSLGSGSLCDSATCGHAVNLEMEGVQEADPHPQRKAWVFKAVIHSMLFDLQVYANWELKYPKILWRSLGKRMFTTAWCSWAR